MREGFGWVFLRIEKTPPSQGQWRIETGALGVD